MTSINPLNGHVNRSIPTTKDSPYGRHLQRVLEHHQRLEHLTSSENKEASITICGNDLALADIVAASRHRLKYVVTQDVSKLRQIDATAHFLTQQIEEGLPIYGVNTGFGGSAATRTSRTIDLQKALLQFLQTGIMLPKDIGLAEPVEPEATVYLKSHCLPRTVVRASILARCNSLVRGHSAVRKEVIEALLQLLNLDFIPVVPSRGSISASGDLMPLSYVAGALEGDPGIYIDCPVEQSDHRKIVSADEALRQAGVLPFALSPKEGLAIVNGTVVCSSLGTLALHEAQYLVLIAQALTGMCTEAMRGSIDNFHPFIGAVRPHPGQIEAAANIARFLLGSKLATSRLDARHDKLAQDRYPIRTAPQWIAPYLEDMDLAASQLEIELNSTTDNPLFDMKTRQIHNGGNFQATAVTSASEKTRLGLQMLGKLLFSQNSELINPMMNGALPPNLSFDDPSFSFTFKGVDINMAAYMSELAFLANPISPYVQSAEMNNQAINSLALLSARYTHDAVELVSMMAALHLYTCCQALDLQIMRSICMGNLRTEISAAMPSIFESTLDAEDVGMAAAIALDAIDERLQERKESNLHQQALLAAEATVAPLVEFVSQHKKSDEQMSTALACIVLWKSRCAELVSDTAGSIRQRFAQEATALADEHLSRGSRLLYGFVRDELKVPLHKGVAEHASYNDISPEGIWVAPSERVTIGKQVSTIYQAIRDGRIYSSLVKSLT